MDYLLAGVVFALLPLVIARPFAGAILYTALAYLRPQNLVGGIAMSLRLSLIVLAATIVGLGIAMWRGKEKPLFRTPWFALVLALLGTYWIAMQTAIFPALATEAVGDFAKVLAGVAVTVAMCTTIERVRMVILTVVVAMGAMTVISLVNPVWDAGRLTGAGGNFRDSNDFALALAMLLPLLLCTWKIMPRPSVRMLLIALVPVAVVASIFTSSRGGSLALAAMLIAWALTTRGRVFKLALAPAAVLAFLALAPSSYLERITSIKNYAHDSSARDRISSWRVATEIAEDRPLTGVGPGNFLAVYDRYKKDFRRPHVAHNSPLQMLANAGVPALAVFSIIVLYGMGTAARLAVRARQRRRLVNDDETKAALTSVDALATGIGIALIAYAVGSQFLSREDMDLLYLLTGLTAALAVHARRELATYRPPAVIRARVVESPCTSIA